MDEFNNPADSKSSRVPLGGTGSSGSSNAQHKAVIKNVDMEKSMEEKAIELASEGLGKFSMEKDMAEFLKREFDRLYGTTWHCVVGKK
jgi:dynein light chain LC8-type